MKMKNILLTCTVLAAICATGWAAEQETAKAYDETRPPVASEKAPAQPEGEKAMRPPRLEGKDGMPRGHRPLTEEQRAKFEKFKADFEKMTPEERKAAHEKFAKEHKEAREKFAKEAMAKLTPEQKAEVEQFIKDTTESREKFHTQWEKMTSEQKDAVRANSPRGEGPRFGGPEGRRGPKGPGPEGPRPDGPGMQGAPGGPQGGPPPADAKAAAHGRAPKFDEKAGMPKGHRPLNEQQKEKPEKFQADFEKMTPEERKAAHEKFAQEHKEAREKFAQEALAKLTPEQKAEVEAFLQEAGKLQKELHAKWEKLTSEQKEAIRVNRPQGGPPDMGGPKGPGPKGPRPEGPRPEGPRPEGPEAKADAPVQK